MPFNSSKLQVADHPLCCCSLCELFQSRVVRLRSEKGKEKEEQKENRKERLPRSSHEKMNQMMASRRADRMFYEELSQGHRLLTLKIAMKCADIGHCCTPLGQHLQWCLRLEEEVSPPSARMPDPATE